MATVITGMKNNNGRDDNLCDDSCIGYCPGCGGEY